MKLGILGLPGCGKSTLFDLLTETFGGPDFSKDPTKPRSKTVKVHDPRLERLRDDYHPRKYTPAALEVFDFPAVSREESRIGLADLLAPARLMDALLIVLRAFEAPGRAAPDATRDLEEVRSECLLADLEVVERRLERLEEKEHKRSYSDDDRMEREVLARVQSHLAAERELSTLGLSADEAKRIGGFGFLSSKPNVIVLNIAEGSDSTLTERLRAMSTSEVLTSSARNELEILRLPEAEREVFLREFGIAGFSRDSLVAAGYRAAGLISFFTAGDKEARAWTIRRGETAVEAAGAIHSDMARGFIRAEVVSYEDYLKYGGVKGAREKGHLRLEGKEYVFADGDIVEFRFSV